MSERNTTQAFDRVMDTFESVVIELKECKVHFHACDAVELTRMILDREDANGEAGKDE